MNKLTIQINNLEALERLIGGDTEIEVEIRNSVVQKFTEKHLKPLVNTPVIKDTLNQIEREINLKITSKCESEVATFERNWNNNISNVKLHNNIISEIDRQVRNIIDVIIRENVDKSLKFWGENSGIQRRVDELFKYYTKEHIDQEIRNRLAKIKESL